MIALGAIVTSHSHDDLLFGAALPRGKFIVIWSLGIYLDSFSFYTDCYREEFETRLPISGAFWNLLLKK